MGGGFGLEQQAIIIETVKETPTYLKILLGIIPVVVAFILAKIFGRKK